MYCLTWRTALLACLLAAPGLSCVAEPGGDYLLRWEERSPSGEWRTIEARYSDWGRGDRHIRTRLKAVRGPSPALHLWNTSSIVSVTLAGVALHRPFGSDSYYLLPPDHEGQLLEVHLRTRTWARFGRNYGELGPLFELWLPWARLETPLFVVGSLMVLLGLALLAVALLAAGLKRGLGPYAWLGVFAACLGCVFAADTRFVHLFAPWPEFWRVASGICSFLFPIGLALYSDAVFGDGPWRTLRKAAVACLGLGALAAASDVLGLLPYGTSMSAESAQPAVVLALGFIVAQSSRRAWTPAREGDRSARAWLAGLAVAIVAAVPDFAQSLGLTSVTFSIAPFGQLFFAFTMGVAVEARFAANRHRLGETSRELAARLEALEGRNREVQSLNAELRRQVAVRSRELERALSSVLTPAPRAGALATGEVFDGRFRIGCLLGEGGMGAVYEATRHSDGRLLALKVMTGAADPGASRRFAREAEIAARLQHPRLVSVLDIGVTEAGTMYIAMELVRGRSLEADRARFGNARWATPLLADVAEGLAALHGAGVVHRDLKPGNVLLAAGDDGVEHAKISDFGVARWLVPSAEADLFADTRRPGAAVAAREALTHTSVMIGTPAYMAPELARGAKGAQPSSDVFSFGVLAWETLTGRRPWPGPPAFVVLAGNGLDLPPDAPPAVGAGVAHLIRASLDVEPSRRPTADVLAQALRRIA